MYCTDTPAGVVPPRHAMAAPEKRLYRVIAERIVQLAREDAIEAGARLPSERELAARLEVSRSSLREAVIALEIDGIVEVRGGAGIYLRQPASQVAAATDAAAGSGDVLAARRLVGIQLAPVAARHASGAAAAAILAIILRTESGADTECDFMMAVAHASGNSALAGVVDFLWGRCASPGAGAALPCEQSASAQRAIHRAIVVRDEALARRSMKAYLEQVAQARLHSAGARRGPLDVQNISNTIANRSERK